MMILQQLYTGLIRIYGLGIRLKSLRDSKAKAWLSGRKNWKHQLKAATKDRDARWIWFHCASLGEFEQARNLIDYLYDNHPECRLLITFFSASGYEIRHNYPKAHHVAYLPLDTPANARHFLEIVKPAFAVFIKYELWYNFLSACESATVPLILIAARPNPQSASFRWPLKPIFQQSYLRFAHIFTQDDASADLLTSIGHPSVSVSWDTRFDRVTANKDQWSGFPDIAEWLDGRKCLVAGSTWPRDEEVVLQAWLKLPEAQRPCLIIAPHDIHIEAIDLRVKEMEEWAIRYRDIDQISHQHQILWIDRIGMLSHLYAYGDVAYIGGAFGKGLHNILEAAVFGNPILIGPRYDRFPEAVDLMAKGSCMSVSNAAELAKQLRAFLEQEELRQECGRINTAYVSQGAGATETIIQWLESRNWLG